MRTVPSYLFALFLIGALALLPTSLFAQQQEDPKRMVMDDLQFDLRAVSLPQKAQDTLEINLFVISYSIGPREFKLNTYGSPVVDKAGRKHLFSQVNMGRVRVQQQDKQNYIHFLLEEDMPVAIQLKYANWPKDNPPQQLLLTFEDSSEAGKFITLPIDLKTL